MAKSYLICKLKKMIFKELLIFRETNKNELRE